MNVRHPIIPGCPSSNVVPGDSLMEMEICNF